MVITSYDQAAKYLLEGRVGLVPADTIYGISCLITDKSAVERIYFIKGRDKDKPFIILIPDVNLLREFKISPELINKAKDYWPGRNTLVFDLKDGDIREKYYYLHRGTNSLGFRVPDVDKLAELLKLIGPIVSTSANVSYTDHVTTIEEARKIFGDKLDFYLDVGELKGSPSRVYKVGSYSVEILRK